MWTLGATRDLQEIYEWLEDRREGSGDDIVKLLNEKIELIKAFPEMAKRFSKRVRRLPFGRRREFGLFYAFNGRRLAIVAVADLRQSPDEILRILRQRGV